VDGNLVRWQKWEFRVGFNYREGLVLHGLGYRDGADEGAPLRPVLHRASLVEMAVPYADPRWARLRRGHGARAIQSEAHGFSGHGTFLVDVLDCNPLPVADDRRQVILLEIWQEHNPLQWGVVHPCSPLAAIQCPGGTYPHSSIHPRSPTCGAADTGHPACSDVCCLFSVHHMP
jgi:hypothetical protein